MALNFHALTGRASHWSLANTVTVTGALYVYTPVGRRCVGGVWAKQRRSVLSIGELRLDPCGAGQWPR